MRNHRHATELPKELQQEESQKELYDESQKELLHKSQKEILKKKAQKELLEESQEEFSKKESQEKLEGTFRPTPGGIPKEIPEGALGAITGRIV